MAGYLAPAKTGGVAYLAPAIPPAAVQVDTTAPVMVGSIAVSNLTFSGATLSWSAATDDVGVAGYEYSTNGGTTYSDVGAALSVALAGLAPSTTYAARVRAYDAAGNRSSPLSASVTTTAYVSGPASAGQSRRSSVSRHRYN